MITAEQIENFIELVEDLEIKFDKACTSIDKIQDIISELIDLKEEMKQ